MKNLFIYNQLKKDFLWDFSYKITFFGQFIGMFLTLIIFFFLGETFGAQKIDSLERYDNNYMLFAIIGVGVLDYISMLLRSLSTSIRNAQAFGYIDNIINSGLNELYVILCAMLYPLVKGLIKFSIYLIMASFLSDNELTIELYLTILLVLTVSTVPFIGVALIAGCFILVFKQGDPINYFVNIIVSIFSGIIYPVSVCLIGCHRFLILSHCILRVYKNYHIWAAII